MRNTGVICIALGIVTLLASLFPTALAESPTQFVVGLGCSGFLAFPLMVTGVILTRRAAARIGSEGEAIASAASLQRATRVLDLLSDGNADVGKADAHGTPMERFRAFDLNSLTVAGWLLVLASCGLLEGEAILFNRMVVREQRDDLGPGAAAVVLGGLLLATAFFVTGWILLKAFGVAICKKGTLSAGRVRHPGLNFEQDAESEDI